MLIPLLMLIMSILLVIGIFIILFEICRDYLIDKDQHKTIHREFKHIQIIYILVCIILLILCAILVFGFYDMLIKNF